MRIQKGDTVRVMTGKNKGRTAEVVRAIPDKNRVIVEGVNVAKRHSKPTRATQQGGIIDVEMFVDISNVQLVCKKCGQPTRVGHAMVEDQKVRICRKCGAEL